jgi:hypothetical protein
MQALGVLIMYSFRLFSDKCRPTFATHNIVLEIAAVVKNNRNCVHLIASTIRTTVELRYNVLAYNVSSVITYCNIRSQQNPS